MNLEGAYKVSSVIIWNREDCCGERLNNAIVNLLDAYGNVITSKSLGTMSGKLSTELTFDNIICSQVKVSGSVGYLSLAEVFVYGFRDDRTNVALGGVASQSSTHHDGQVASLAPSFGASLWPP